MATADLDVSKIVDRAIRNQIAARGIELEVLGEVFRERRRQDTKWGEQNHPDGTGSVYDVEDLDIARRIIEKAAEDGDLTWRDILNEEVREAFAESDPAALRTELIQVAAVCVQWAQAIDRRTQQ